ncbi:hypothetical protein T439DRAFT_291841 [Meredithblackwellia eburnea MCA 4105]
MRLTTNRIALIPIRRQFATVYAAYKETTSELASAKAQLVDVQAALSSQSSSASISSTSSSSSSAPSSTSSSTSPKSVKKGLGYNTASYTNNFDIAWAYNWAHANDAATGTLNTGVEYVPMLWNTVTTNWATDAQAAINSGTTHLLGFNEPDLWSQSNIIPSVAASAWISDIEPFHTQVKLVSPAITNGGPPMGVTWMSEFLGNCTSCHVDAIAAHWYDAAWNVGYFQNYFTDMYSQFGKPIWITEFAGSGTVSEQQAFFQTIIPWMESQPFIERYSAFGAFSGTFVNADGSLTPLGETYNDTV